MRRVDWPDEEGWWWVIQRGEVLDAPMKFHRLESGGVASCGYESCGDEYPWRNNLNQFEFEGPIPEPKMPLRFEINGTIQVIHCTWSRASSWKEITIKTKTTGKLPPAGTRDKRFKITFEELP